MKDETVFETVLREAGKIVSHCKCGGEDANTSCYNCLRSYSNQRVHDKLQRKYVLDFLDDFFSDNLQAAELMKDTDRKLVTSVESKSGFDVVFGEFLAYARPYIDNKRRFVGLMRDYLSDYPKEMNLMIAVYQAGLHTDLVGRDNADDTTLQRSAERLIKEIGISRDQALWALKIWRDAYVGVYSRSINIEYKESDAWEEVLGLLFDEDTLKIAKELQAKGVSAPEEVGIELLDEVGAVMAEIELAWTEKKVGYMLDEKIENKRKVENAGWTICSTAEEIMQAL